MEDELNYLKVLISEAECEIIDKEQYFDDNPDDLDTLDEIRYWEQVQQLLNNILSALSTTKNK
jgi:hypothetical protein